MSHWNKDWNIEDDADVDSVDSAEEEDRNRYPISWSQQCIEFLKNEGKYAGNSYRNHYNMSNIRDELPPELKDLSSIIELSTGRYNWEFSEIAHIAKGSFGSVFHVKSRIDGGEYAVKKIVIPIYRLAKIGSDLKEIQTLSKLNHTNIVPYKTTWIEPLLGNGLFLLGNGYLYLDAGRRIATAPPPIGEDTEEDTDSESLSINNQTTPTSDPTTSSSASSASSTSPCQPGVMIYMQMALCQLNLRKWLDDRNSSDSFDEDTAVKIFRQIAYGLKYIHEMGIIHGDIKPQNIFVSINNKKLLVQLGDFGLACTTSQEDSRGGTETYEAPEQLKGKCEQSNDIYSCGLVLLELLAPFKTGMERAKVMMDARDGQLPQNLLPEQLGQLIPSMLSEPKDRPTADMIKQLVKNEKKARQKDAE